MHRADVVFTGGFSLWEAKSKLHTNAHAVPSSVDLNHFAAARQPLLQPLDQAAIAHPRLGFFPDRPRSQNRSGGSATLFQYPLPGQQGLFTVACLSRYGHLVYSGPIDEYFDYCFGKLPYRSLRFQHETINQLQFQAVAVVNYPDEAVPYTRITEYKHLTGQTHPLTSISYEFPCADGDPYYPVPRPENAELYKRYRTLAEGTSDVTFLGRLGTYKYYNMDQVVGQALALYQRIAEASSDAKVAGCEAEPNNGSRVGNAGPVAAS